MFLLLFLSYCPNVLIPAVIAWVTEKLVIPIGIQNRGAKAEIGT